MKITAGKWYTCRMGQQFWIAAKLPWKVDYPYIGANRGAITTTFWDEEGRCLETAEYSLIEEYQEPTTETMKLPTLKYDTLYSFERLDEPLGYINNAVNDHQQAIKGLIDFISSLERRVAALEPDKDAWRDN